MDEVLSQAARSAQVTHSHPEGIKGAQAVAASVFLARTGADPTTIMQEIEGRFSYDLSTPLKDIRPTYEADESCQGSIPQALRAFLEGTDWESSIRNAVSLGGHSKSQSAISGSVAEASFRGVPAGIWSSCRTRIPEPMRKVCAKFSGVHNLPTPSIAA
jgi:ADP-ribosylglycohydrolase